MNPGHTNTERKESRPRWDSNISNPGYMVQRRVCYLLDNSDYLRYFATQVTYRTDNFTHFVPTINFLGEINQIKSPNISQKNNIAKSISVY